MRGIQNGRKRIWKLRAPLLNCIPRFECGDTWRPFHGSAHSPAGTIWLQIKPWLQWSTPSTVSTHIEYRYFDDTVDYYRPTICTPLVARIYSARCNRISSQVSLYLQAEMSGSCVGSTAIVFFFFFTFLLHPSLTLDIFFVTSSLKVTGFFFFTLRWNQTPYWRSHWIRTLWHTLNRSSKQSIILLSRSQWHIGLRHELSSRAETLEPWVRILLKA
jgi:hypothetical protein